MFATLSEYKTVLMSFSTRSIDFNSSVLKFVTYNLSYEETRS